jgi:hypothetical protein
MSRSRALDSMAVVEGGPYKVSDPACPVLAVSESERPRVFFYFVAHLSTIDRFEDELN